jgi:hypothetical protein
VRFAGTDSFLLKLPKVQQFFKAALLTYPPKQTLVPEWQLPEVLDALSRPPFEPIDQIDIKYLTIKTAFLVAIASSGRTCELKAFDRGPLYCTISPRGVALRVPQSFRPKVVKPQNIGRSMTFAPLHTEEEPVSPAVQAVCVCRAIEAYIKATKPFIKPNVTQLFVTFQKGRAGTAASKVTIANWIKTCVYEAYNQLELDKPEVHAHSTRKQSATWAELKNVSIKDICTMASWSSSLVFAKHYRLKMHDSVSARHARAVLTAGH